MELQSHKAIKDHPCDSYFYVRCAGTGKIGKGETYYSPSNDWKDTFHPYRICMACVQAYGITRPDERNNA